MQEVDKRDRQTSGNGGKDQIAKHLGFSTQTVDQLAALSGTHKWYLIYIVFIDTFIHYILLGC